jgi:hypothetical protein
MSAPYDRRRRTRTTRISPTGRPEEVADRTEGDARRLGIGGEAAGTRAQAGEMRVAAFLVREEALAVSEEESPAPGSPEDLAESPPLEAQA